MNLNKIKRLDKGIIIYTLILLIIGLVALYSATNGTDHQEFKKQIIWILIGIPVFLFFVFVDYRIISRFSPILYGTSIVLLGFVLLTGKINGASSWFNIGGFSLQPGEFAKIMVVLFLANTMSNTVNTKGKQINQPLVLLKLVAIVLFPVVLIALEPDFGTAMAYAFALVFMLYVAGIDKRYIIVGITLVVILVPLLYFFVLPEHAKARIDVYLNPYLDPRGDGYNIIQSKIAIGAGGLLGLGFLKGTQTHLGYLYPKSTDFIFSVIGEEFGFILCSIIVIIYVLLINRCIIIGKTASDDLGSYIALGLCGILFFHVLENIGMTIGLLPITGVPLPFVSYGGSSMLTNMMLIGLIINIGLHRSKSIFTN